MLRLLAGVSLLLLTAKASSTGRELLVDTSINTVGITIPANCASNLADKSTGYRAAGCNCKTTGAVAYNVNQGTAQNIKFSYSSTQVLIGGSYNDQFLANGNGCDVTVDTKSSAAGTALANGINGSSIIDITFAPTQAVCNQFTASTIGDLSFLAFDTKGAVNAAGAYTAQACKFQVELKLLPNALSSVDASQLFPQADAADSLPGSFLKMAAMAVLGGGLMLFMLL